MIHPDQLELYENLLKAKPEPEPEPPAGVGTMITMNQMMLCSQGHHAWVPWLKLESGSHVTWCIHCKWQEQYDA